MIIDRPCPNCRTLGSVGVEGNLIKCHSEGCHFQVQYCCPLCDTPITTDMIDGDMITCGGCQRHYAIKKVHYLLANSMVVDKTKTCQWCNGPTIYRADSNLSHRCFFFPKCAGQADLFAKKRESLVFLDFETTGLDPVRDHIIEIGALKIDHEGYDHTFQLLIKPPVEIDERITKITGITNDMVANCVSVKDAVEKFIEFLGDGKIIAHNADFDIPWLLTALKRLQLEHVDNQVLCTLKWARKNGEARASLGALTKKYGISHQNAHRALADASSTRELYMIFENTFPLNKLDETLADYMKAVV